MTELWILVDELSFQPLHRDVEGKFQATVKGV